MRPFIEHIVEPTRLLLYWQAEESGTRSRYRVGELVKCEDGNIILKYDHGGDEFEQAKRLNFKGYPAFKLDKTEHSHQVQEAFMRRLPPRSRRDFARYIELKGISPTAEISDFALLGYSGAKLPNDGFELMHPFDEPPREFEFVLEVAGFRHESEISPDSLMLGSLIQFRAEPMNQYDSQAIRVEHNGSKLGYVARSNLLLMHRMLKQGADIMGEVFHTNGTPERPLVYLMTRIKQRSPTSI